ncbi:hypothetical protein [Deinococcus sonorensis]|uniref:Uncharacterized protein n=2 Tax=Deinococcus sonorensis TaxID=309891 RepID=A0AAU7UEE6_9DEIO
MTTDRTQDQPSPTPASDQPGSRPDTTPDQTPVSDDQQQQDHTGTHGRPSDDSDPGHS